MDTCRRLHNTSWFSSPKDLAEEEAFGEMNKTLKKEIEKYVILAILANLQDGGFRNITDATTPFGQAL